MKPQADSTRGWIVEAFHRLVLRHRYGAINVARIVTHAGVGRSTFYEHFSGKAELLRHAVAVVLKPFAAAVTDEGERERLEAMLEHVQRHRVATLAMLSGPGGADVERTLVELIESYLDSGASALPRRLLARQIASAQLGVLRGWLELDPRPISPASLAASLMRTTRALAQAGQSG